MAGGLLATHIVQNDELVGPTSLVGTNGIEDTSSGDSGDQLLEEKEQKSATNGSQVEVVNLEEEVELEGFATAHDFSATKDDNVVGDEHSGSGAEGRHGSLALDKFEILRPVALDRSKDLFENGPELKTERTVERRQAIADPIGRRHVVEGAVCLCLCGQGGCAEVFCVFIWTRRMAEDKQRERRADNGDQGRI